MAAAGRPRIEVRGAKELRRALKSMGDDLKDLTATNKEAAQIVEEAARQGAPVDSGALRGTIKTRASRASARIYAGSNSVVYAGPIHFGWPAHNIEPQPFLYEAADERAEAVFDIYNRKVEDLVRKVGAST